MQSFLFAQMPLQWVAGKCDPWAVESAAINAVRSLESPKNVSLA
jgi:tRNA threonylcarbamoyladenosine modification (KEOPS) complex Cgi121 subunit